MTAEGITEATAHRGAQNMNGLRVRRPRSFTVGGDTLMVRVRESQRARTARIIVGPRRPLEVIVPRGTSDTEVDGLLEKKRRWVERKVVASREIAERAPRLGLGRRGVIWLDGHPVPVERRSGHRAVATMRNGRLVVAGSDGDAGAAVERWYRREARQRVENVTRREAARLGLDYVSIAIRDPRTRWGSCSRKGNLSFSWRLVAAPSQVLEYVVVHELCHLREPSHSKPFWRLLDNVRPAWQEQAGWLREHGRELHGYNPVTAVGIV